MCMLPNSEVLLADKRNKKLKKLNTSYKVISVFNVTEYPYSVCYIGQDTAVVSLGDKSIEYVNVSGKIKLRQLMKLDHKCNDLACHGDTLYINSENTIYKYDKFCKQKQIIFDSRANLQTFNKNLIAISDNGERIYFTTDTGLATIDANGNFISSEFVKYDISDIHCVCIAGQGIVLVLDDTKNVHLLDYTGKKHHTVDNKPLNISIPHSMCFDRERCRLIFGGRGDKIHIYKCEFLPS